MNGIISAEMDGCGPGGDLLETAPGIILIPTEQWLLAGSSRRLASGTI